MILIAMLFCFGKNPNHGGFGGVGKNEKWDDSKASA